MLSIGQYQVLTVVSENFALDGGAMFGSVPKTLWSKKITPDFDNRIPLCSRSLVIRFENRVVLVDLGCGRKWNEKLRTIYDIKYIGAPLHEVFLDVTDVILTHLHFDHAGGVSYLNSYGELKLSFPNAKHYLLKENWQHAQKPGVRERASYLLENIDILNQGQLLLLEDSKEILPGLTIHKSDGHTNGLGWIKLVVDSETIVFPADLIPTAHHISVPYVMGYDLCAKTTMDEKEAFLEEAVRSSWIVVFEHDRDITAGRISKDEKGTFMLKEKINF